MKEKIIAFLKWLNPKYAGNCASSLLIYFLFKWPDNQPFYRNVLALFILLLIASILNLSIRLLIQFIQRKIAT